MKPLLLVVASVLLAQSANAQEGPTLSRIADSKSLSISYRDSAPPFSYLDSEGKPVGYSIDICSKIADAIKKELGLDELAIKYVPVTAQTRIPIIANGTADIECAATAITLDRFRQVDYLFPTFVSNARLLVKKGSGITGLDSTAGKVLTTLAGTTSERALMAALEEKGIDAKIVKSKDNPQGMLNLEQGRVDGFFSADVILSGVRANSRNPDDYEMVGESLFSEPYAFMVPRNDPDFRLLANRVLADLFSSGEINTIYKKWFDPGVTKVNIPMSPELSALISAYSLAK